MVNNLDDIDIFELVKIVQKRAFSIAASKEEILDDEKRLELALGLLNAVDNLYMGDTPRQRKLFAEAEKIGIHILRPYFKSPLPVIKELDDEIWRKTEDTGIRWNEEFGLSLLEKLSKYSGEFLELVDSNQFDNENPAFIYQDAAVYYSMIRHFKPKNIIEVGGGYSTKIASLACLKNGLTNLTCIEPYPRDFLKQGFPGLTELIEQPVQKVPTSKFKELGDSDILFIDSTHVSKIGSDVNYLFLEVLPQLNKGVIIQIHDIFLPFPFMYNWIKDLQLFWNEQYILHAFLIGNYDFEVMFGNHYMMSKHPETLKKIFDKEPMRAGSFWMRKIR